MKNAVAPLVTSLMLVFLFSISIGTVCLASDVLYSNLNTTSPDKLDNLLDKEEAKFLELINDYRHQNGIKPLKQSEQLNRVAKWMSQDMASNNYFSHKDSKGGDSRQRMNSFGYVAAATGENIAAGNETAEDTFQQWKKSPGHNKNMLDSDFNEIGIGRVYSGDSNYKWYWTTDFGGPF